MPIGAVQQLPGTRRDLLVTNSTARDARKGVTPLPCGEFIRCVEDPGQR